jgi:polysaccharide pyruvyl transferase WcaK-like protein
VFAGARTHATIAAISSGVPTLSLGYSTKAFGLNQDIFGSQDYCVHPGEFSPAAVSDRLVALYRSADRVREHLAKVLPAVKIAAQRAGTLLRSVMAEERVPRNCKCMICRSP